MRKISVYRKIKRAQGITLIELLMALFIAVLLFGGLFAIINYSLNLQEMSRSRIHAINAARDKMEEIRNTAFTNIVSSFNNSVFPASGGSLPGFNADQARGRVTITDITESGGNLLEVRVVVCWRQRNGRLVGEDMDLDGNLDSGEDTNSNGLIDSPCVLATAVRRTN